MKRLRDTARRFIADESGQGTVEWVLITALVVVVIMGLIVVFKDHIKSLIDSATTTMKSWGDG